MKASLAICLPVLLLSPWAAAEALEEERWYSADGQVVKTVKRTATVREAGSEPDWEPAWVQRERVRDSRIRVSYSSPFHYRGRVRYGWGHYRSSGQYYYPRSTSSWGYCNRLTFSGLNGRVRLNLSHRAW